MTRTADRRSTRQEPRGRTVAVACAVVIHVGSLTWATPHGASVLYCNPCDLRLRFACWVPAVWLLLAACWPLELATCHLSLPNSNSPCMSLGTRRRLRKEQIKHFVITSRFARPLRPRSRPQPGLKTRRTEDAEDAEDGGRTAEA